MLNKNIATIPNIAPAASSFTLVVWEILLVNEDNIVTDNIKLVLILPADYRVDLTSMIERAEFERCSRYDTGGVLDGGDAWGTVTL